MKTASVTALPRVIDDYLQRTTTMLEKADDIVISDDGAGRTTVAIVCIKRPDTRGPKGADEDAARRNC